MNFFKLPVAQRRAIIAEGFDPLGAEIEDLGMNMGWVQVTQAGREAGILWKRTINVRPNGETSYPLFDKDGYRACRP